MLITTFIGFRGVFYVVWKSQASWIQCLCKLLAWLIQTPSKGYNIHPPIFQNITKKHVTLFLLFHFTYLNLKCKNYML